LRISPLYLLALLLTSSCDKKDSKLDTTCSDTDFLEQIVTPNLRVLSCNAISPNGDLINDNFIIYAYTVQASTGAHQPVTFTTQTLKVYTAEKRQLVFESLNYRNEFNGRDTQGKELPEGKYFYEAKLDANSVQGSLVVVRNTKSCDCRTIDANDDFLSGNCQ
jgi:hypothetical protein